MDHPFTDEELHEIGYDALPEGWMVASDPHIVSNSRWYIKWATVITNGLDYYRVTWRRGATETQDAGVESPEAFRVYPHQQVVTVYKDTP